MTSGGPAVKREEEDWGKNNGRVRPDHGEPVACNDHASQ
jgi:hypothetical protein